AETRAEYWQKIESNQDALRIWAENCEENFKHQYLLVEAERARITDRVLDAENLYEQAIHTAHEHGFVQDEALANELASRFYSQRKLFTSAHAYLKKSRGCYLRWGAHAKVQQLDRQHPHLRREEEESAAKALDFELGNLDFLAVVKGSQAISGEIVLSRLVETLMRTVLENAGAQKGLLILAHGDELTVKARARVIGQKVKVSQEKLPSLESVLAVSMLNYVKRTGEIVIVDDASEPNLFSPDPYIKANNPISVLCLPLLRQAQMVGMLYLENNIIRGAFTKQRIAVLELLAAQAAISLENAALYLERSRAELALRESEEKYRAIFEDSGTPLVFIEEDKTISICNTAFERLTGYDRSEVEGRKKWTELVGRAEDLARMAEYHRLRRIDPQAAPQTYEFQLIDREGKLKDVVATVAMMSGTQKSLGALLDITERKRAVEALHRNEQKLKAIFDSSFQFIGLLDVDGILLQANETSLKFAGVQESSVVGLPFWETVWMQHSSTLQEKIRAAVKEAAKGRFVRFEIDHYATDGSLHYFDFSLKPMKDDAGKVVLLIPEGRDITERKQAEEEQARLATAIEQSAEAVFITDTHFIIRYANPALERMSGFDRNELIGRHIRILANENHNESPYTEMFDSLTQGSVWSGRLFYLKKSGTSYEAEVTASPVRDKMGTIINYVSIHRDITREVQLERELRQAHKMEAIGTLAGGIAHDFNNILSVIQGHTQLTNLKLPKSSPLQHSLNQVLVSCGRAKDLVSQILAFCRQSDHAKRPTQLLPLVSEVLQLLRSTLPATIEIRLDIKIPPEQSVILADPTQIHQVLMN
ncbi:MAG: PAS domain S-box protein, partial [Proteobacteria bacterium]|nr:PAS domain S-box protein [Pseudomonadota bacterium]